MPPKVFRLEFRSPDPEVISAENISATLQARDDHITEAIPEALPAEPQLLSVVTDAQFVANASRPGQDSFIRRDLSFRAIDLSTNMSDGSVDVSCLELLALRDDGSDFTVDTFTLDVYLPTGPMGQAKKFHIINGQKFLLSVLNQAMRLRAAFPKVLRDFMKAIPCRIYNAATLESASNILLGTLLMCGTTAGIYI